MSSLLLKRDKACDINVLLSARFSLLVCLRLQSFAIVLSSNLPRLPLRKFNCPYLEINVFFGGLKFRKA